MINNMYPISVIVPIYNVERYIEKCARSLFEQTLDNLEILFIDDCTPDNSLKIISDILKEYPNRKQTTRIISMSSNGGLAAARRRGIIEARGEFIIHCDGDDWVDKTLYRKMYDKAKSENLDIVVCDFIYEYTDGPRPHTPHLTCNTGKELLKNWYRDCLHMSCANKLVKKSLHTDFDILPWVGLNMWEDNGLMSRLLYHADKVGHISGPAYHYNRCNESAMTNGYGMKQVEQMIDVAKHIDSFLVSKPDANDFEKTCNAFKYLAKINLITDSFKNHRRFKQLFPESDSIASELDPQAFSTKGKIRFDLVRHGGAIIFIMLFKLKNLIGI